MSLVICTDPVTMIKEYARVRHWLMDALQHGNGSINEDALIQGLLLKEYCLWASPHSAMVSQIFSVPISGHKSLFVFACGGDLTDIKLLEPIMSEWARDNGCQQIEISGRKGWERALAPYGFQFSSQNIVKRL